MNTAVRKLALFTRDLLGYDEQLIRLGRMNFTRADFETNYIVVDSIAAGMRRASLESFDGDAESLSIGDVFTHACTLDFYGDSDAYNRAVEFCHKARSQAAAELKKTLGLTVYRASQITDLKALTGQQYGERVQVSITVETSEATNIDTLRIDTLQLAVHTEQGQETP